MSAAISDGSSTISPREVFMKMVPGFMASKAAASNRPSVSGDNGAQMATKSLSPSMACRSAGGKSSETGPSPG